MTISVEDARDMLFARCARLGVESVPILDALGRVLAADAVSDVDVAPFDNSAMDGYALRAADVAGASEDAPIELEVLEHVGAGAWPERAVGTGQSSRIMTGAPMPEGADSVVMVEYTTPLAGDGGAGGRVGIGRAVTEGENVRRRAEEVSTGDVVLAAGDVLGAAAVGLLAATGHETIDVYRRPRVAVLSTGDELVEVSEKPGPGKIRNSNSYSIAAQVRLAGGVPERYGIVPDELEATREAIGRAVEETDFVVASGGVSVGDFDFVKPVLEELGDMDFCKVAMRPGNPQTMGSIRGVPFFGLPGNPTSTYVGFEIFVRPALRLMQGFSTLDRPVVKAVLAHDVKKRPDRRYYLRARLDRDESGRFVAQLSGRQSSALLTAAHKGNCLLVLPEGVDRFDEGTDVDAMRLDVEEGTP
jgi:molybdopterin molybdotransferase